MRITVVFIFAVLLSACQKETDAFLPSEKFSSIFDNPSAGVDYEPIDFIQTADDGYLILSSTNSNLVFLLKVSARGEFVWSRSMSSAYINPIGKLVQSEGNYYFIASDLIDGTATLVEVNDFEQTLTPLRSYTGFRRPLAFDYLNPNNFLLLTNNDTIGAVLSKIQQGFAMEWARGYDELENANQKLDDYLLSYDPQFFLGAYNNGSVIYFNALRPEGIVLTYTNEEGIETGRISASGPNGVNSLIAFNDGTGAVNYNLNNQSFFANQVSLANTDSVGIGQLGGELVPDRMPDQMALSLATELSATPYTVNAYTTVDGRIKLSFYDGNSGELAAIDYLGGNDPLQLVAIKATADQGIVILAKTIISGLKERIAFFKIPKEEMVDML